MTVHRLFSLLQAFARPWLGALRAASVCDLRSGATSGFFLILLAMAAVPSAADAMTLAIDRPLCHATTAALTPPADPTSYRCTGEPASYQQGTLWLRADLSMVRAMQHDAVLLLHMSRFDGLIVLFHYADGSVVRQQVLAGDYGSHWRVGGQIAFTAPVKDAALTSLTLGFDHLATHNLLRIRILTRADANWELAIVALLAGGSLTLLLAGAIYNLSLAIAVRRQFLAWHGLWAACVLLWGFFWSQAALLAFPDVAGTAASQTCTLLSCFSIAAATISIVTALRGVLPRAVLIGVGLIGIAVAVLGIPASFVMDASLDVLGAILSVLTLVILAAVAACMAWAWRRGSGEARDLAKSWGVPMAILALTTAFDFNDRLFGGGSQIAVLFASALQTVWLGIASTRRLAVIRVERDAARAAEAALAELANRDPLTGLLNRRGFVERLRQTFIGGNEASLGLLLIDVDLFKSINDQFGHEAGDRVLVRIADYFRKLERELCIGGRVGGEEFVLAISGLTAFSLQQFADRVRIELGALTHGEVSKHRAVTVSIGVAEGSTVTPFQRLYAAADRALYDAKRSGRNRVVISSGSRDGKWTEDMDRDQFAFEWSMRGQS